jgi:hypothetical protein
MILDWTKNHWNTQSQITVTGAGTVEETILEAKGRTIEVQWMDLRPDSATSLVVGYRDVAGVFFVFDSQAASRVYDAGFKWRLPKGADFIARVTWSSGTNNAQVLANGRYI